LSLSLSLSLPTRAPVYVAVIHKDCVTKLGNLRKRLREEKENEKMKREKLREYKRRRKNNSEKASKR